MLIKASPIVLAVPTAVPTAMETRDVEINARIKKY
jgi:hypothetical protein